LEEGIDLEKGLAPGRKTPELSKWKGEMKSFYLIISDKMKENFTYMSMKNFDFFYSIDDEGEVIITIL
jgi:hypothetical protein